jgi:hypothetical protein
LDGFHRVVNDELKQRKINASQQEAITDLKALINEQDQNIIRIRLEMLDLEKRIAADQEQLTQLKQIETHNEKATQEKIIEIEKRIEQSQQESDTKKGLLEIKTAEREKKTKEIETLKVNIDHFEANKEQTENDLKQIDQELGEKRREKLAVDIKLNGLEVDQSKVKFDLEKNQDASEELEKRAQYSQIWMCLITSLQEIGAKQSVFSKRESIKNLTDFNQIIQEIEKNLGQKLEEYLLNKFQANQNIYFAVKQLDIAQIKEKLGTVQSLSSSQKDENQEKEQEKTLCRRFLQELEEKNSANVGSPIFTDKLKRIAKESLGELNIEIDSRKCVVKAVNASFFDIHHKIKDQIRKKLRNDENGGNLALDFDKNGILIAKHTFGTKTLLDAVHPAIRDLIERRIKIKYGQKEWDAKKKFTSDQVQDVLKTLKISYKDIVACFIDEIEIIGSGKLFYDTDDHYSGVDLTIRTNDLSFGTAADKGIALKTSGRAGIGFEKDQADEKEKSAKGQNGFQGYQGENGEDGQHAGNINIKVSGEIENLHLLTGIEAEGGNGANGQSGGNGGEGGGGAEGQNGKTENIKEGCVQSILTRGTDAQKPGNGGNAGKFGLGGRFGFGASINIVSKNVTITHDPKKPTESRTETKFKNPNEKAVEIKVSANNGTKGCDGDFKKAKGGKAGKASSDGMDQHIYRHPSDYRTMFGDEIVGVSFSGKQKIQQGKFFDRIKSSIDSNNVSDFCKVSWSESSPAPSPFEDGESWVSTTVVDHSPVDNKNSDKNNLQISNTEIKTNGGDRSDNCYYFRIDTNPEQEKEQSQRKNQQEADENNTAKNGDHKDIRLRNDDRENQAEKRALSDISRSETKFETQKQETQNKVGANSYQSAINQMQAQQDLLQQEKASLEQQQSQLVEQINQTTTEKNDLDATIQNQEDQRDSVLLDISQKVVQIHQTNQELQDANNKLNQIDQNISDIRRDIALAESRFDEESKFKTKCSAQKDQKNGLIAQHNTTISGNLEHNQDRLGQLRKELQEAEENRKKLEKKIENIAQENITENLTDEIQEQHQQIQQEIYKKQQEIKSEIDANSSRIKARSEDRKIEVDLTKLPKIVSLENLSTHQKAKIKSEISKILRDLDKYQNSGKIHQLNYPKPNFENSELYQFLSKADGKTDQFLLEIKDILDSFKGAKEIENAKEKREKLEKLCGAIYQDNFFVMDNSSEPLSDEEKLLKEYNQAFANIENIKLEGYEDLDEKNELLTKLLEIAEKPELKAKFPNIILNGFSYILSNFNFPLDEKGLDKIQEISKALNPGNIEFYNKKIGLKRKYLSYVVYFGKINRGDSVKITKLLGNIFAEVNLYDQITLKKLSTTLYTIIKTKLGGHAPDSFDKKKISEVYAELENFYQELQSKRKNTNPPEIIIAKPTPNSELESFLNTIFEKIGDCDQKTKDKFGLLITNEFSKINNRADSENAKSSYKNYLHYLIGKFKDGAKDEKGNLKILLYRINQIDHYGFNYDFEISNQKMLKAIYAKIKEGKCETIEIGTNDKPEQNIFLTLEQNLASTSEEKLSLLNEIIKLFKEKNTELQVAEMHLKSYLESKKEKLEFQILKEQFEKLISSNPNFDLKEFLDSSTGSQSQKFNAIKSVFSAKENKDKKRKFCNQIINHLDHNIAIELLESLEFSKIDLNFKNEAQQLDELKAEAFKILETLECVRSKNEEIKEINKKKIQICWQRINNLFDERINIADKNLHQLKNITIHTQEIEDKFRLVISLIGSEFSNLDHKESFKYLEEMDLAIFNCFDSLSKPNDELEEDQTTRKKLTNGLNKKLQELVDKISIDILGQFNNEVQRHNIVENISEFISTKNDRSTVGDVLNQRLAKSQEVTSNQKILEYHLFKLLENYHQKRSSLSSNQKEYLVNNLLFNLNNYFRNLKQQTQFDDKKYLKIIKILNIAQCNISQIDPKDKSDELLLQIVNENINTLSSKLLANKFDIEREKIIKEKTNLEQDKSEIVKQYGELLDGRISDKNTRQRKRDFILLNLERIQALEPEKASENISGIKKLIQDQKTAEEIENIIIAKVNELALIGIKNKKLSIDKELVDNLFKTKDWEKESITPQSEVMEIQDFFTKGHILKDSKVGKNSEYIKYQINDETLYYKLPEDKLEKNRLIKDIYFNYKKSQIKNNISNLVNNLGSDVDVNQKQEAILGAVSDLNYCLEIYNMHFNDQDNSGDAAKIKIDNLSKLLETFSDIIENVIFAKNESETSKQNFEDILHQLFHQIESLRENLKKKKIENKDLKKILSSLGSSIASKLYASYNYKNVASELSQIQQSNSEKLIKFNEKQEKASVNLQDNLQLLAVFPEENSLFNFVNQINGKGIEDLDAVFSNSQQSILKLSNQQNILELLKNGENPDNNYPVEFSNNDLQKIALVVRKNFDELNPDNVKKLLEKLDQITPEKGEAFKKVKQNLLEVLFKKRLSTIIKNLESTYSQQDLEKLESVFNDYFAKINELFLQKAPELESQKTQTERYLKLNQWYEENIFLLEIPKENSEANQERADNDNNKINFKELSNILTKAKDELIVKLRGEFSSKTPILLDELSDSYLKSKSRSQDIDLEECIIDDDLTLQNNLKFNYSNSEFEFHIQSKNTAPEQKETILRRYIQLYFNLTDVEKETIEERASLELLNNIFLNKDKFTENESDRKTNRIIDHIILSSNTAVEDALESVQTPLQIHIEKVLEFRRQRVEKILQTDLLTTEEINLVEEILIYGNQEQDIQEIIDGESPEDWEESLLDLKSNILIKNVIAKNIPIDELKKQFSSIFDQEIIGKDNLAKELNQTFYLGDGPFETLAKDNLSTLLQKFLDDFISKDKDFEYDLQQLNFVLDWCQKRSTDDQKNSIAQIEKQFEEIKKFKDLAQGSMFIAKEEENIDDIHDILKSIAVLEPGNLQDVGEILNLLQDFNDLEYVKTLMTELGSNKDSLTALLLISLKKNINAGIASNQEKEESKILNLRNNLEKLVNLLSQELEGESEGFKIQDNVNKFLSLLNYQITEENINQDTRFDVDYINQIIELSISTAVYKKEKLTSRLGERNFYMWRRDLFKEEVNVHLTKFTKIDSDERGKLVEELCKLEFKDKESQQELLTLINKIDIKDENQISVSSKLLKILKSLNSGKLIFSKESLKEIEDKPFEQWHEILSSYTRTEKDSGPKNLESLLKEMRGKSGENEVNSSISALLSKEGESESKIEKLINEIYNFHGKKFNEDKKGGKEQDATKPKYTGIASEEPSLKTKPIYEWNETDVKKWAEKLMEKSRDRTDYFSWEKDHLPEIIAVLAQASKLQFGYYPKYTQLISLALFLDSSNSKKGRLGNVSTGEGKTLITAMLATAQALIGERVDVVTSSNVLAEEGINQNRDFITIFGLNVGCNCDNNAEKEGEEGKENRRKIYKDCQIIYGDTGSFERDILLTEFFGDKIRPNDIYGVSKNVGTSLVLDEVDSMLVDNSSKTLYISHNIIDMRHLRDLFLYIWNCANAPNTSAGDDDAQELVESAIQSMMERGDIKIPGDPSNLKEFVNKNLKTWIANAYRAKLLKEDDHYIIGDKESKKEGQIIPMAKDTGVEQMNTNWNNGLTQFLQLKHSLKLTDESLKAVFISNINYFKRYKNINGMTGTIGGVKERSLLADNKLYDLNFFEAPRFKKSLYIQEEGEVVGKVDNWYDRIKEDVREKMNNSDLDSTIKEQKIDEIKANIKKEKLEAQGKITAITKESGDKSQKESDLQQQKDALINLESAKKEIKEEKELEENDKNIKAAQETIAKTEAEIADLNSKLKPYEDRIKDLNQELESLQNNSQNNKRATLIICDNIDDAKKLKEQIEKEFTLKSGNKIIIYDRSYDGLKDKKVNPGDIIIATNIAGRGTDFETSKLLEANGGMHVILSYMPPNLRVEWQAFGRTARNGKEGTGKFIIFDPRRKEDEDFTIDYLRDERDEQENERLQELENKELPKIEVGSELFEKFNELNQEINRKIKEKYPDDERYEDIRELQLVNLRNHWAFWLNQVDDVIGKSYDPNKKAEVFREFEEFKKKMILQIDKEYGLVSDPIELSKLGFLYYKNNQWSEATLIFDKVIKDYPDFAEQAHYYRGLCFIGNGNGGCADRIEAKKCFVKAKHILEAKMGSVSARSQTIKAISELYRNNTGKGQAANLFELDCVGEMELIKGHLQAIENAIGGELSIASLRSGLIDGDKLTILFDKLFKENEVVKDFRLSKKVRIEEEKIIYEKDGEKREIVLPENFGYIKSDVLGKLSPLTSQAEYKGRKIPENLFEDLVLGKEKLLTLAKKTKEGNEVQDVIEKKVIFTISKELQNLEGNLGDKLFDSNGMNQGNKLKNILQGKESFAWKNKQLQLVFGVKTQENGVKEITIEQFKSILDSLGITEKNKQTKIINYLKPKQEIKITNNFDFEKKFKMLSDFEESKDPIKSILSGEEIQLSSGEKFKIIKGRTYDEDKLLEAFKIKNIISNNDKKGKEKLRKILGVFGCSSALKEGLINVREEYRLVGVPDETIKKYIETIYLNENSDEKIENLDFSDVDFLNLKSREIKNWLKTNSDLTLDKFKEIYPANLDEFRKFYPQESTINDAKKSEIIQNNFRLLRAILKDNQIYKASIATQIDIKLQEGDKKYADELEDILEDFCLNGGKLNSDANCLKSKKELSKELWMHFHQEGVIKDRKVNLKIAANPDIEAMTENLKSVVNDIFRNLKQDSFADYINPFAGTDDSEFEKYVNDVVERLKVAAGTLRVHDKVKIESQDLLDLLTAGKTPPAIMDYIAMSFSEIVNLIEKKEFKWDWNAFAVAMIGLAQIAAGSILAVCTFGAASTLSSMLISEGIGDMVFAIESAASGEKMKWKAYSQHKVLSLSITIVTMGVGKILAKGAQVAKQSTNAVAKSAQVAEKAAKKAAEKAAKVNLTRAMVNNALYQTGLNIAQVGMQVGISQATDQISKLVMEGIINDKLDGFLRNHLINNSRKDSLKDQIQTLARTSPTNWNVIFDQALQETMAEMQKGSMTSQVLDQASRIASAFANTAPKGKGWGNTIGSAMKIVNVLTTSANVIESFYEMALVSERFYDNLSEKLNQKFTEIGEVDISSSAIPLSDEELNQKIQGFDKDIIEQIKEIARRKILNEALDYGINKINSKFGPGKLIHQQQEKLSHQIHANNVQWATQLLNSDETLNNRTRKKVARIVGAQKISDMMRQGSYDNIKNIKPENGGGFTIDQLRGNSNNKIKVIEHNGQYYVLGTSLKNQIQALEKGKNVGYGGFQAEADARLNDEYHLFVKIDTNSMSLTGNDGILEVSGDYFKASEKTHTFGSDDPSVEKTFSVVENRGDINHQMAVVQDGNKWLVVDFEQSNTLLKNQCALQNRMFKDKLKELEKNNADPQLEKKRPKMEMVSEAKKYAEGIKADGSAMDPSTLKGILKQERDKLVKYIKSDRKQFKTFFHSKEFINYSDSIRGGGAKKRKIRDDENQVDSNQGGKKPKPNEAEKIKAEVEEHRQKAIKNSQETELLDIADMLRNFQITDKTQQEQCIQRILLESENSPLKLQLDQIKEFVKGLGGVDDINDNRIKTILAELESSKQSKVLESKSLDKLAKDNSFIKKATISNLEQLNKDLKSNINDNYNALKGCLINSRSSSDDKKTYFIKRMFFIEDESSSYIPRGVGTDIAQKAYKTEFITADVSPDLMARLIINRKKALKDHLKRRKAGEAYGQRTYSFEAATSEEGKIIRNKIYIALAIDQRNEGVLKSWLKHIGVQGVESLNFQRLSGKAKEEFLNKPTPKNESQKKKWAQYGEIFHVCHRLADSAVDIVMNNIMANFISKAAQNPTDQKHLLELYNQLEKTVNGMCGVSQNSNKELFGQRIGFDDSAYTIHGNIEFKPNDFTKQCTQEAMENLMAYAGITKIGQKISFDATMAARDNNSFLEAYGKISWSPGNTRFGDKTLNPDIGNHLDVEHFVGSGGVLKFGPAGRSVISAIDGCPLLDPSLKREALKMNIAYRQNPSGDNGHYVYSSSNRMGRSTSYNEADFKTLTGKFKSFNLHAVTKSFDRKPTPFTQAGFMRGALPLTNTSEFIQQRTHLTYRGGEGKELSGTVKITNTSPLSPSAEHKSQVG